MENPPGTGSDELPNRGVGGEGHLLKNLPIQADGP